jgi:hypothetical protein
VDDFVTVPVVGDPVTRVLPYSWDLGRWEDHRDGCAQCAHIGYGAAPCPAGFSLLADVKASVADMHRGARWN